MNKKIAGENRIGKNKIFLDKKMNNLLQKLSSIFTGEMVPFYIQRYGFYEWHTGYREDPIAIACIFGLKNIEEIERAFEGKLYQMLFTNFTRKSDLWGDKR
ncbi:MAG: hypothetical protein ACE5L7_10485 [Candidatus Aminicenantales bacterium]